MSSNRSAPSPNGSGNAQGVLGEEAYKAMNVSLYSLILVLGLTGNALLIATITRHQSLKTTCNYFILSIAVADLCVAVVSAPLRITEVYVGWPFGEFLCHFLAPLQDVFVCVSVVTHTVIAFERYRCIVTPLKPKIELDRAKQLILAIWLGCYLLVGVPVIPLLHITADSRCRTKWTSITSRRVYMVYLIIVFILLPLIIQTAAYARIIYDLRSPNSAISRTGTVAQRAKRMKRKAHLVKMLVILVAIFQICYIPRGIQMLLWEFGNVRGNVHFEYADLLLFVVYYLKHVINPVILFAMSTDFRGHCKRDVPCSCFGGFGRHGQVDSESGSCKSSGTEATQVPVQEGVNKNNTEGKRNSSRQAVEDRPVDTKM